jgi:hypothetical protein
VKASEILRKAAGTRFVDRKGKGLPLKLLPGLPETEITDLETKLGFSLPIEIRDLLLYCRGFEGFDDVVEFVDFGGICNFYSAELPHGLAVAKDVCGNHWVVDLVVDQPEGTAVFYACHDPPVYIFQADSIGHFISEVLRRGNDPWTSEIDYVHDECDMDIWTGNPGVLSRDESLAGDQELKEFAESMDDSYLFVDLRNPSIGQGFSWGRYGANTICKRYGEKRLFAYQKRELSWLQKIFGA